MTTLSKLTCPHETLPRAGTTTAVPVCSCMLCPLAVVMRQRRWPTWRRSSGNMKMITPGSSCRRTSLGACDRWQAPFPCIWATWAVEGPQCLLQYLLRRCANVLPGLLQDFREEQRAKRRRLLSAAATACIRRGMIRYLQAWAMASQLSLMHSLSRARVRSVSACADSGD